MVVTDGKVLLEEGDLEARGYMAAGRFPLLAMAYGKYVEEGRIDLDLTLGQLGIEDYGGLLPLEKEATIRDLLTSRDGVFHPTQIGAGPDGTPTRGTVGPGSEFHYHPWGGLVAKPIFELLTDVDLFQAVGEDLAAPLGLQDFKWWRQNPGHDRDRSRFTVYNFYLSTRDLARFGQLMLQGGGWEGEQLIPAGWVRRITSMVTPPEEIHPESFRNRGLGFGYWWWVWDAPDREEVYHGAYTDIGSYGNYLTVLPKLDMVVAHQVFAGWFGPPETTVTWNEYREILDRLVGASLPPAGS
jgi:CubicO group peptidase (beta-lactamase class C family)